MSHDDLARRSMSRHPSRQTMGPYRVHPLLTAFPWVSDDEFAFIVASIKTHGLLRPITLTHDKTTLVDGRIRYRACEEAMVDPVFTTLPEGHTERDVLDFIVSMNLRRQHLTPEQRAAITNPQRPLW